MDQQKEQAQQKEEKKKAPILTRTAPRHTENETQPRQHIHAITAHMPVHHNTPASRQAQQATQVLLMLQHRSGEGTAPAAWSSRQSMPGC